LDSLAVRSENLSASLSTIRDADIAKETSNLTKQQILQQASSAVLTQANSLPSIALSLLS
jgi:flagellin